MSNNTLETFLESGGYKGRCFLLICENTQTALDVVFSFCAKAFNQKIFTQTSPDITILSNYEKSIVVKDCQAVIEKASQTPLMLPSQVFIIHDFNKVSAVCQNKLLKTIEEASDSTIFFLIASGINNVLQTIKSRSVVLHLWESGQNKSEQSIINAVKSADVKALEKINLKTFNNAVLQIYNSYDIIKLLDEVNARVASNCNWQNTLDWFFLKIEDIK